MRAGAQVQQTDVHNLIQPVTHEEIDLALHSIDDLKAPGIDSFNSLFFKRSWHIIKWKVYEAMQEFFEEGIMPSPVNYTLVTLVPKLAHPNSIKDFRPIACCSLLYNIIAKILTMRLQKVVGTVVDLAQAGFIPNITISDNILLPTELIKGYST